MRAPTVIFIVGLVAASACQDTGVTSVPLPAPTTLSPTPPPPAPAAISVLEMSNVRVIEYPPSPPSRQYYSYVVTFWLTEVTGLSGATVQGIGVSTFGASDGAGQGCWRDVIRVEPGGTLDVQRDEHPQFRGSRQPNHLRKLSESMGDRWRQSAHLGDPALRLLIPKPHATSTDGRQELRPKPTDHELRTTNHG